MQLTYEKFMKRNLYSEKFIFCVEHSGWKAREICVWHESFGMCGGTVTARFALYVVLSFAHVQGLSPSLSFSLSLSLSLALSLSPSLTLSLQVESTARLGRRRCTSQSTIRHPYYCRHLYRDSLYSRRTKRSLLLDAKFYRRTSWHTCCK